MRKKSLTLLIVLAIFASMFTGCTKYYYDQDEVTAMTELGESIVSDYLEQNDIDATIVSCEATIYGGPVRYLTAYANGILEEDGVTYEFYVDTETSQIYTGKYSEEIFSAAQSKFYDFVGFDEQDFIDVATERYEFVLPNKWGNENVPTGIVAICACVAPIEVTDIEEYIASDDSLMLSVTFEGTTTDEVDLSILKGADYLDTFAEANILPSSVVVSNRLFNGNMYPSHMFYYEYELTDFEEFEMAVMTHSFEVYGDDIDDYVYEVDDVTIEENGDSYNFSLLERYNNESATTRLRFYFTGDTPPELSYTFTQRGNEVTVDCGWVEYDDGIWLLTGDRGIRVFKREEFVITRR